MIDKHGNLMIESGEPIDCNKIYELPWMVPKGTFDALYEWLLNLNSKPVKVQPYAHVGLSYVKWAEHRWGALLPLVCCSLYPNRPIPDTDDYGNMPVVEPFDIHTPSHEWLVSVRAVFQHETLHSSWDKMIDMCWFQDRRERAETDREKEQYKAGYKAPRHTAEEKKVWDRKVSHAWRALFWDIHLGRVKCGSPRWKEAWGNMHMMEPNSPEESTALKEWRQSLWRRSIDAAGLELKAPSQVFIGAWCAWPRR